MKNIVIGIVALIVIIGIVFMLRGNNPISNDDNKELRIGYIVYPPLLIKDPKTGALSGISYDIVEASAKELGLKTNWVEEVGWGTALEGLQTNRYELLGTQMWPNEAREKVAIFSKAPMNSVLYPYIKAGDTRFTPDNLGRINNADIKVSAVDGEMAVFIAGEDYPKAKLMTLPQLSSYAEVFLNITQGKADVSFAEPSAVEDFNRTQDVDVVRLGDTPVRSFGNSFAMKKDNTELMNAWNSSITNIIARGEIDSILEKHGVKTHYMVNK